MTTRTRRCAAAVLAVASAAASADTEGDRLEVEAGRRVYRYRSYASGKRGDAPDSSSQSTPQGRP